MTTNSISPRANLFVMADAASPVAKRFIETIREWRRRARSRRDLMGLSERELWDLCLSRADARREADKAFWRE